jgi:hypothetical protein
MFEPTADLASRDQNVANVTIDGRGFHDGDDGCSAYGPASVQRRAFAVTLDAAVLATSALLVVRRHLTNASVIRLLAVLVVIQAA